MLPGSMGLLWPSVDSEPQEGKAGFLFRKMRVSRCCTYLEALTDNEIAMRSTEN